MASLNIPNLPEEILCKIIEMVGADSFYYLGGILRAGKRGYALVHEPSALRKFNVQPMVNFATCQICTGGQFQEFFIKCVTAGNKNAIYYEGLYATLIVGPQKCIRILQPNVPNHDLSTLAVGIFNVCIGNDKEASKLFQQFAANHYDLRSDAIVGLGADLEWRLISFGAPYMNRYGASFKFPDDEVIKSPSCLYGHDYTVDFEAHLQYSYTVSIRIPSVFVYRQYSYTVSIRIPSVFVYRQYSYTVSIRIPSVFVYRQYSYTVSIRIPSVFVYRQYSSAVSIRIPSVFVYREYSYTVSIRIPSVFEYR
uniref:F-box domain-containing protein n=1 Tax=Brassica oleracea var. oleracea TaxID=109376 RepID=A0A0D3BFP0_BRAOL